MTIILFVSTVNILGATADGIAADYVPFGGGFRLTYEKSSHFSNRRLHLDVDGEANGTAHLEFTGDSRGDPWDEDAIESSCRLKRRLVGELRVLLQQAKLLEGQFWGIDGQGQDLPFNKLVIHDGSWTAVIVTSFNKTFDEGPRKRIIEILDGIDADLSAEKPPADCQLRRLD